MRYSINQSNYLGENIGFKSELIDFKLLNQVCIYKLDRKNYFKQLRNLSYAIWSINTTHGQLRYTQASLPLYSKYLSHVEISFE